MCCERRQERYLERAYGTNPIPLRFVHQYDEEYEELKKARRPGRGASAKEDLLKVKISTLEKEYQNGFCKQPHLPPGYFID